MSAPTLTIIGNLANDPELRHTRSGAPVCNFTIASTPRRMNKETREWEDGETVFQKCTVWMQYAEAVADSLSKGDRVIATGVIEVQSWTDRENIKRSDNILRVEEIGLSPRYAQITSSKRSGGGGKRAASSSSDEPWATPAAGDDTPF